METILPCAPISEDVVRHFFRLGDEGDTPAFPIELASWDASGYTLRDRDGARICHSINYVKTFGGAFPTIAVHLIANRFVAYPETLRRSKVSGDPIFNDKMAVTHVYDLIKKKRVYTSKPYQYNHDISPLFYEKEEIPGYVPPPNGA